MVFAARWAAGQGLGQGVGQEPALAGDGGGVMAFWAHGGSLVG